MTHSNTTPEKGTRFPTLRGLQITGGLAVLSLLFQFLTAGQLFPDGGPEALHAVGAVAVHVCTGLVLLAAAVHWRLGRGPGWTPVLAGVTFVLSFVQAYFGDRSSLWLHVPGALILTVGVVWLLAWSYTPVAGDAASRFRS